MVQKNCTSLITLKNRLLILRFISLISFSVFALFSCGQSSPKKNNKDYSSYQKAYFASGCFWCVEAIYESVSGVAEAISGYSGGIEPHPTYHNLGSHAETVQVLYDSSIVDFATLVQIYYGSQDPTTIGQNPDFGEHYRSIIFYQNTREKEVAENAKRSLQNSGLYRKPIVTEIKAFDVFHRAEEYHQDYEKLHPNQSYVKAVSIPRLNRFKESHKDLLKQ